MSSPAAFLHLRARADSLSQDLGAALLNATNPIYHLPEKACELSSTLSVEPRLTPLPLQTSLPSTLPSQVRLRVPPFLFSLLTVFDSPVAAKAYEEYCITLLAKRQALTIPRSQVLRTLWCGIHLRRKVGLEYFRTGGQKRANSNAGAFAIIRSDARGSELAVDLDGLLRVRDETLDRVEELRLRRSEVEDLLQVLDDLLPVRCEALVLLEREKKWTGRTSRGRTAR